MPDNDPREWTVPAMPIHQLPLLYEATADEADGQITAKRIKKDGTLVGDELTFDTLAE